jgi:hypothetical protein
VDYHLFGHTDVCAMKLWLGVMWMPDDSQGNYRNVFQYQQLDEM